MSHGSVTMRHGGSVDDRIGVAEERDGLGRTCSGSETARDTVPRSRRKNEANRPTGAPVPLPSLAPFFSALAVLFLQPGTLFPVPPESQSWTFFHRKKSNSPRPLKIGGKVHHQTYTPANRAAHQTSFVINIIRSGIQAAHQHRSCNNIGGVPRLQIRVRSAHQVLQGGNKS